MATFKSVFEAIAKFPGRLVSGFIGLIFGYDKDKKQEKERNGLFGTILDAIKAVSHAVGSFFNRHSTAMSVAFWSSLVIGAAVGITLFALPTVLAAVAGFSVYGLSVAGIVGANALVQAGVIAGLAAAATSAAVYTVAAVYNTINWIRSFFAPKTNNDHGAAEADANANPEDEANHSHSKMSALGPKQTFTANADAPQARSLFTAKPTPAKAPANEEVEENAARASMSV